MERSSNVNVTSKRGLTNVNVNVVDWVNRQRFKAKQCSQDNLEAARNLQKVLGADEKDVAFFRKCYNRLGRKRVEELRDRAMQDDVHLKVRYFAAAAKAQPEMHD